MNKQDIITITEGVTKYSILRTTPLFKLTQRTDLIILSMKFWENLINELYGTCPTSYLGKVLLRKIAFHDNSQEVNSFFYNGNRYWFDKVVRNSLFNLASNTKEPITLLLGDDLITIPRKDAVKFLADLESYASKCYITTHNHLTSVKRLHSITDMIDYDYTSGYPEKLNLNDYL